MNFLQTYRNRLINLGTNNRALSLLRLAGSQELDLSTLDFIQHTSSFEYIRLLLQGKKEIPLLPSVDARSGNSNKISQQIKKIQRKDHWLQLESGSQDLFLGWPFVEGKMLSGTAIRCPLLLFPIRLKESGGSWYCEARGDQTWVFNKTFQLAYAHYNQIPLAQLEEPEAEDFPADALAFRTQLFEFFRDQKYELHFNRELFEDRIQPFPSISTSDLNAQYEVGQLKLKPHAVIGFFPYAGSWLVNDYDQLEEKGYTSLSNFFPEITTSTHNAKEEHLLNPLSMDASQEEVLKRVKAGHSLVVQGPPGTGKSQLIVNMIADFCARGKKVLLVSQKRAALEVVKGRLKQLGLDDFSALVHDIRAERSSLFQQLVTQIEKADQYEQENTKLDTVLLEREFASVCRLIDATLEKLEQFKVALYDTSRFGISVKELYLSTSKIEVSDEWKQLALQFDLPKLTSFSAKVRLLLPRVQRYWEPQYAFAQRMNFNQISESEVQNILSAFSKIEEGHQWRTSQASLALSLSESILPMLWEKREELQSSIQEIEEESWVLLKASFSSKKATIQEFEALAGSLEILIKQKVPVLTEAEIESLNEDLEDAYSANSGVTAGLTWNWKAPASVQKILKRLGWTRHDLDKLNQVRIYWVQRSKFISKLAKEKWMPTLTAYASESEFQTWRDQAVQLLQTKKLLLEVESYWAAHAWKKMSVAQWVHFWNTTFEHVQVYAEVRKELLYYFPVSQLHRWWYNALSVADLSIVLKRDWMILKETDSLIQDLNVTEEKVLKLLSAESNASAERLENLFKCAWISDLESKAESLIQPDTGTLAFHQEELQQALLRKRQLSLDIIKLKLKEFTYKDAEYNRLNNRVTYRELLHQCSKKKKIWPVRKVVQEFHEEVFRLIPCWMASPETVSALFPMEAYFDLIVFDEASQCFTEKGLPAITRARQVVVAGDSKQLRPGDLYRVRWESEEEQGLEEEVDSLLELASASLPQYMLKYHYRSSRRELIEFSNKQFYRNQLELISEFEEKPQQRLFYHKVEGRWKNQTNEAEADKVVSLVEQLLREGKRDIGIVTFNFTQAEIILEKLEEFAQQKNVVLPEELFVKNLENVQGDERDYILFSIAYAPDTSGKIQLRMGSLNQEDGPNRLNVAVSRARKEIHVVSSLLPSQLETERIDSEGPKLLKQYLHYVWEVSKGNYSFESNELPHAPSWYLKSKLQNATWRISEISLMDLQNHSHALLTDDDQLFTKSCKAYFGLIPLALKEKGWKVEHAYSRSWWNKGES